MKECKAVYMSKYKIRDDRNLVYDIDTNLIKGYNNEIGSQYSKIDNILLNKSPQNKTRRYFGGMPKQIYAYHGRRSFTDIGVGSVKALQRRKVRRVYLPETNNRGVGSSDLSSLISRRSKPQVGYYDRKRKSSKCVGGFTEHISVINQQLSPIVQTRSGSTSPKMSYDQKSIETGSNTVEKSLITIGTQFEVKTKDPVMKAGGETEPLKKSRVKGSEHTQKYKNSKEALGKKILLVQKKVMEEDKGYSSDSLVQHVHNLENPSDEKQSRTSIDPMENKLEREYRRMFTTQDSKTNIVKTIPEFKSASILRRRFEDLRRGLVKKDEAKNNNMPSSEDTVPSRIDVSVTSDPPSLEGRSFTDTQKYNPALSNVQYNMSPTNKPVNYNAVNNNLAMSNDTINNKAKRNRTQWPQSGTDSECQGVKGMFNLWGKKFKFEDEPEKPKPLLAIDFNKKPQKSIPKRAKEANEKSGRKFFFFKKKSKDQKEITKERTKESKKEKPKREKKTYHPSGVTAGRCEIKDGLTIKLSKPNDKVSNTSVGNEIQRETWFKDFLTNSTPVKSVNVRWNNSMYATSSSTVFELMDTMYKNNGVVIKSRSEITSEESSYYKSYTKNKVNFDQKIEAWMIPNTVPNYPKDLPVRILSNNKMKGRDVNVTISNQKWLIEKCKAFANKIEVVLHATSFNKITNKDSSQYLKIDIPKDFFDTSSSDDNKQDPTSDEEVYKIVEYESDLNTIKALDKKDHASEIKVEVSVQDANKLESKILETVVKKPPMHRDVVIQGSKVSIPKRYDVIGVGIITQRDMREIKKPILKIQDYTDGDSKEDLQANQKKSEFAESYLQEYYRHSWTPQGIDLFSWCVSDPYVRSTPLHSEKSLISLNNQGDGSKSYPNICEDLHRVTIVSPCDTSCSECNAEEKLSASHMKRTIAEKCINKCKIPFITRADTEIASMRFQPKDSLEVFRKRKIYARSLKSKWRNIDDTGKEVAILSDQGCDKVDGILRLQGIEACKKLKSPKHAVLITDSISEIHPPECEPFCLTNENPACELRVPTMDQMNRPCTMSLPPCHRVHQSHDKFKTRRKASPKIQFPVPTSPSSNPNNNNNVSNDNLALQLKTKYKPVRELCRKCQHKLPCFKYPDCKLSLQSLKKEPKYALPESPNQSPGSSPTCSPCLSCSSEQSLKARALSSPHESPNHSPGVSPQQSLKKSPVSSTQECRGTCLCTKQSPIKSPSDSCHMTMSQSQHKKVPKSLKPEKPCRIPPCNQIGKTTKKTKNNASKGDQHSYLTKNQVSTSSSCLDNSQFVEINKCKKKCPMMQKTSNLSLKFQENKYVPDCDNRRKKPKSSETKQQTCNDMKQQTSSEIKEARPEYKQQACPNDKFLEYQHLTSPAMQQGPTSTPPPKTSPKAVKKGLSGLFFRLKPTKKTCSKECTSWADVLKNVVKLSSNERITISMKRDTPSTEEIRECMNVKVRDEDGNTLFERKDYNCKPGQKHKPSVLGDMYKDSNVNRAEAPVTIIASDVSNKVEQQELADIRSEASIANLIEIQLKLQTTNGDKTTEMSIANDKDPLKQINASGTNKIEPDVYVVETDDKEPVKAIEDHPKNDISIKIVVKNYKPLSNKIKTYDNDFSKNISNKFQTVSTGYSDVLTDQNDLNAFSVQRTTFNLHSNDKLRTVSKHSNELVSEELAEPIHVFVSSHSTEHLVTDVTEDKTVEISISSKKNTQSYETFDNTNELDSKDLDSDQDATIDLNTSDESIDIKYNTKEKQKELLKKVFEKTYKMPKNKENVRQLRDSLKIILTDSSDTGNTNISNELVKDTNYNALKPNLKTNDSMSNYYKMESFLTVEESKVASNVKYPTRESTSNEIGTSKCIKPQGCMCSRLAERLNCDLKIGCCCKKKQIDEITSCDITNNIENDKFLVNYRTEYVNVQTQNSKHLTDKSNSINLSIQSRANLCTQNENDQIRVEGQPNTETKQKEITINVPKAISGHKVLQTCEMKKLNQTTILGISNDDKIILVNDDSVNKPPKPLKRKSFRDRFRFFKASDVLQCYEIKKAVLEIYAEKTVTDNGEHIVAKLPKFLYEKESEITRNYQQIAANNYKSVCQRNVYRMTLHR